MIQLTVSYGHPTDPTAFDLHYKQTHSQLALKIPGLKGYFSSKPGAVNPKETPPYYLVAELFFDDMATFQSAMQSPEGQATAADANSLATGGVTMTLGQVDSYVPITIS